METENFEECSTEELKWGLKVWWKLDKKDSKTALELAKLYKEEKNYKKALSWAEKSAKLGNEEAVLLLTELNSLNKTTKHTFPNFYLFC